MSRKKDKITQCPDCNMDYPNDCDFCVRRLGKQKEII